MTSLNINKDCDSTHIENLQKLVLEKGLDGNTVVGTIMSNIGLFKALKKAGIDYKKTTVGDKYVNEAMVALIIAEGLAVE